MLQKLSEIYRLLGLPPVQLFHSNNELLEKLPNHNWREKVLGIDSNYDMDK